MAGKITRNFRIHNAAQFYEMFSEAESTNLYFFISKATPWTNDSAPDAPVDSSFVTDLKIWNEMLALKKITAANVTFGIYRNNWIDGVVYEVFDSEVELDDLYYIVTDEYQVYKCLGNNQGGVSSVKPTLKDLEPFMTSDGYIWKYMYSTSVSDSLKFLTPTHIPVKTLTTDNSSDQWDVQEAGVFGSVSSFKVVAGGSGYISTSNNFQFTANTTTATLATTASGVDNAYNGMSMYITAGVGVGQLTEIVDYDGPNKLVTVSPSFSIPPTSASTYLISPKVSVTGNGANSSAYSQVSSGSIFSVTSLNAGHDYTNVNVAISAPLGTGAEVHGMIAPLKGHGSDPVRELHGHNVIMSLETSQDDSNFLISNDYRTIGIIADPLLANNSVATNLLYNQTSRLTLTGETGNFLGDEVITGSISGATGILVTHANNVASVLKTGANNFVTFDVISGGTSSVTANVSTVTLPDLNKYTGNILYFENRTPVNRTVDQRENIRFVVKF